MPGPKKAPFRKWFGCLGEIKSLIPNNVRFVIVTATATVATRAEIIESLQVSASQLYTIEENPNKANLMYILTYMDKHIGVEEIFSKLIVELQTLHSKAERTLIYCQTRKQCALLFRLFEVHLGPKMFYGKVLPQNRVVEMFHAGSPQSVKDHVLKHMTIADSYLRVAICTIAFGMGVNCKEVRRVVHFGPSKNIEQYIQESGRAGRDGKQSVCIMLYNGMLAANCEKDMKELLQSNRCRRQDLLRNFSAQTESKVIPGHNCCDICSTKCDCDSPECGNHWSLLDDDVSSETLESVDICTPTSSRLVNHSQKHELTQKLLDFQKKLIDKLDGKKSVSCPNMLLEFNKFHIRQVLANCHLLFSIKDVFEHIEIWRNQYAYVILQIIAEVFKDIEFRHTLNTSSDDISSLDKSIDSVWSEIRNDSYFDSLFESLHETIDYTTDENVSNMSVMESDTDNSALFDMLLH